MGFDGRAFVLEVLLVGFSAEGVGWGTGFGGYGFGGGDFGVGVCR